MRSVAIVQPLDLAIALGAFPFGHVFIVDAQRARKRNPTAQRVLAHHAWLTQGQRNAYRNPLTGNERIIDPITCHGIALAQTNRRLEDPLVEQWILRIALAAAAAFDAGTASVTILAEIEPAATSRIGEIRPLYRVAVALLQWDRFAAADNFRCADDMT